MKNLIIQRIIGSILYYTRVVDLTVLMALSTIASKHSKATENTVQKTKHNLDYLVMHLEATVQFYASNMKVKHSLGCVLPV